MNCPDCNVPLTEPPPLAGAPGWWDGFPTCPKCGTEFEVSYQVMVEVTLPGPARKQIVLQSGGGE